MTFLVIYLEPGGNVTLFVTPHLVYTLCARTTRGVTDISQPHPARRAKGNIMPDVLAATTRTATEPAQVHAACAPASSLLQFVSCAAIAGVPIHEQPEVVSAISNQFIAYVCRDDSDSIVERPDGNSKLPPDALEFCAAVAGAGHQLRQTLVAQLARDISGAIFTRENTSFGGVLAPAYSDIESRVLNFVHMFNACTITTFEQSAASWLSCVTVGTHRVSKDGLAPSCSVELANAFVETIARKAAVVTLVGCDIAAGDETAATWLCAIDARKTRESMLGQMRTSPKERSHSQTLHAQPGR